MEIIFTIIGIIMALYLPDANSIKAKTIIGVTAFILVVMPYVLTSVYTTKTHIIHADVIEHQGTRYTKPQLFLETVERYPFWSYKSTNKTFVLQDGQ